jgi:hypothetical protein
MRFTCFSAGIQRKTSVIFKKEYRFWRGHTSLGRNFQETIESKDHKLEVFSPGGSVRDLIVDRAVHKDGTEFSSQLSWDGEVADKFTRCTVLIKPVFSTGMLDCNRHSGVLHTLVSDGGSLTCVLLTQCTAVSVLMYGQSGGNVQI